MVRLPQNPKLGRTQTVHQRIWALQVGSAFCECLCFFKKWNSTDNLIISMFSFFCVVSRCLKSCHELDSAPLRCLVPPGELKEAIRTGENLDQFRLQNREVPH